MLCQQLEKIAKRGCIIDDEQSALEFLKRVNYYRLTAYFLPFKTQEDKYISGTNFSQVVGIYQFDHDMRKLLFPVIEEIELALRSQIAYFFGHRYGALGYLDKANFSERHNHENFLEHIEREKEHNKQQPFVQHHNEKYSGKFPIWVIIELFSMGELSLFYADMKRADQKGIAKAFAVPSDKHMKSWLKNLTILRNFCAHYSRLYDAKLPGVPRTPKGFGIQLGNRLFDYIVVLKLLYSDSIGWTNSFAPGLCATIEKYRDLIELKRIGFPADWEKIIA
ncbi:Abi family protein [Acutalibacter sp. 1XD8-36]|nr:Abi family protein [Acutalibacter sp. 1XD8-36]